ncbi:hypothetical protein [Streptomyces sp. NBC_01803]|uniref:hypothetical protein n=1 Tax=Streptomyces sp. NBC_01803 TaxID=2975946 RepID=UPI002DD7A128|nr:hypothetical protein [Streptomyces sp. NBC_01803]WSA44943.1 hypothetical protein OIE51_12430 [Streptomyces sp. NBC_01803]
MRVVRSDGVRAITWLDGRSGPVVEDQAQGTMCWLVERGTTGTWRLPGVQLLGSGSVMPIPPPTWIKGPATRWRIPPRGSCLTHPGRLYEALVVATTERPRPIESFRTAECSMNSHAACTKAEAPPSPRDSAVIYQACDCWCHAWRERRGR